MRGSFTFLFFLFACFFCYGGSSVSFSAHSLTCENLVSPLGIESASPRLSWKINADGRDFTQSAYRILVATSPEKLTEKKADMWDSGWMKSRRSMLVPYSGAPLASTSKYYWTVRIADGKGRKSEYTNPGEFTTGLFNDADWHGAEWIALQPDSLVIVPLLDEYQTRQRFADGTVGQYKLPRFRKDIDLKKDEIKSAVAYVAGLGQFEFFVNGKKAGSHFLDPGWTQYDKEAQYVPFDITDLLADGSNTLGVMLGNGFYNIPNERYFKLSGSFGAPKLKMVVVLDTNRGEEYIVSDSTWSVSEGPVTFSSIYGGEDYDARKADKAWLLPGYDAEEWRAPVIHKNVPTRLHSQPGNNLHIAAELKPHLIKQNPKGHYLYDLGQNFSGIPRIKVIGKKGDKIIIRPGELEKEGSASQKSSGSPHYYTYIIGQDDVEEEWQPQFTYYGFRYLEVEGAVPEGTENPDSMPVMTGLDGLHTTAEVPVTGSFVCSNILFNDIFNLIDWAIRSNLASVLTDCPHREKLGWLEQTNLMQHSLQYCYDLSAIYPKIMRDIATAQHDNGCVPTITPEFVRFSGSFEDTPEWGSTAILSPWYYYKWYGDSSLLEKYYPVMKRYLEYLSSRAEDNIISYGLGDWYDIGPNPPGYAQLTSNGVTATATYYYNTLILRETARLLGHAEDMEQYNALAERIRDAYNRRFYNESTGSYDRGSQTANAISLVLGLTEDKNRERVLDALVMDIKNRGYALTAGDIGYKYVLGALTEGGKSDVVYEMNNRYDVPGYGWQLAHGATALTESWQAYDSSSNNHFMLGHLMEWFFSALAGIGQSDDSVGFEKIEIKPLPCGDLTQVAASLESPYGLIRSAWKKTDKEFMLDVAVPANTQARIWLPAGDSRNIYEHGLPLDRAGGIKSVEKAGNAAVITVGSGDYSFTVR